MNLFGGGKNRRGKNLKEEGGGGGGRSGDGEDEEGALETTTTTTCNKPSRGSWKHSKARMFHSSLSQKKNNKKKKGGKSKKKKDGSGIAATATASSSTAAATAKETAAAAAATRQQEPKMSPKKSGKASKANNNKAKSKSGKDRRFASSVFSDSPPRVMPTLLSTLNVVNVGGGDGDDEEGSGNIEVLTGECQDALVKKIKEDLVRKKLFHMYNDDLRLKQVDEEEEPEEPSDEETEDERRRRVCSSSGVRSTAASSRSHEVTKEGSILEAEDAEATATSPRGVDDSFLTDGTANTSNGNNESGFSEEYDTSYETSYLETSREDNDDDDDDDDGEERTGREGEEGEEYNGSRSYNTSTCYENSTTANNRSGWQSKEGSTGSRSSGGSSSSGRTASPNGTGDDDHHCDGGSKNSSNSGENGVEVDLFASTIAASIAADNADGREEAAAASAAVVAAAAAGGAVSTAAAAFARAATSSPTSTPAKRTQQQQPRRLEEISEERSTELQQQVQQQKNVEKSSSSSYLMQHPNVVVEDEQHGDESTPDKEEEAVVAATRSNDNEEEQRHRHQHEQQVNNQREAEEEESNPASASASKPDWSSPAAVASGTLAPSKPTAGTTGPSIGSSNSVAYNDTNGAMPEENATEGEESKLESEQQQQQEQDRSESTSIPQKLLRALQCNDDTTIAIEDISLKQMRVMDLFYDKLCHPLVPGSCVGAGGFGGGRNRRPYYDEAFSLEFLHEMMTDGVTVLYLQAPGTASNPSCVDWNGRTVTMVIEPGTTGDDYDIQPKLEWTTSAGGKSCDAVTSRMSLLSILSIHSSLDDAAAAEEGKNEFDAIADAGGVCFFAITSNQGDVHVFEASSPSERDRIVDGLKNVIARLSFSLVAGDVKGSTELYCDDALPSERVPAELPMLSRQPDEAMNRIAHALLDT